MLTDAALTRLRTRPHRSKAYLAVYQPTTVLAAVLNMPAVAKGERILDISILAGSPGAVERGMTVYLGSYPGGRDLGRLRAISATTTTLTVAENAIDWVNGTYVTVAAHWEPWAVFSRIVLGPGNVPVFYKDFDLAYGGQGQTMQPVVLMGTHSAGFLETGCYSVYWSSSGTFDPTPGGLVTGYLWQFEGGIPTASALSDPGWVHYTGAGHFTTRLTVWSNAGRSERGYRHVMVYNRPGEGPNPPISAWGIRSLDGSREQGGYAATVWVAQDAAPGVIADGALVTIFTEDFEGPHRGKHAAGKEGRSNILFVGYVEQDSVRLDHAKSIVEFRVVSVLGMASRASVYSATLQSVTTATTWNECRDMTVDRALLHYLRWQSTLLSIADFHPTGNTLPLEYADFDRGDLYRAASSFLSSTIGAWLVADRQGSIWSEVDLSLLPTGSTRQAALRSPTLDLTRQDWLGDLSVRREALGRLAYLEAGGIAYSGPSTGTSTPLMAGAPGDVADYHGAVERVQGLVLASQDQANALAGMLHARANMEFPEVGVEMAGDYRILDIAPQQRVRISLSPSENVRGLSWREKPFIVHELTYEVDHLNENLRMRCTLREETFGPPGRTITIPTEPPYSWPGLPSWNWQWPPLMPLDPIFPDIDPPPAAGRVVYTASDYATFLLRTRNFWDASPTWERVFLSGTTWSAFDRIRDIYLDPRNPASWAYILTHWSDGAHTQNGPRLYRTTNLDSPTPIVTQILDGPTQAELIGGNYQREAHAMAVDPTNPGVVMILCRNQALGTDPARILITRNGGASWGLATGTTTANSSLDRQLPIVIQPPQVYWGFGRMNRSDDYGARFLLVGTGSAGSGYRGIVVDPGQPMRVGWAVGETLNLRMFWSAVGNQSTVGADAVAWDAFIGGVRHGVKRYKLPGGEALVRHPRSGRVYASVVPIKASEPDAYPAWFVCAETIGATWFPIHCFVEGGTKTPEGIFYHATDENKWATFIYGVGLLATQDNGVTWLVKNGNLATVLGSPTWYNTAWSFIRIVWTVN